MVTPTTNRYFALYIYLVLCLSIVCCKEFEFQFCPKYFHFTRMLDMQCHFRVRKSLPQDPIQTKTAAKSFLRGRKYKRNEYGEPSRATSYWEECCVEGCRTEEIMEYC